VPVRGIVVDADGRPVAGAEVALGREIAADALGLDPLAFSLSNGFTTRAFATTGTDGRFEVDSLPNNVAVAAAGDQRSRPAAIQGGELRLTLAATGTLRGRVTFATPAPSVSAIMGFRVGDATLVHIAPLAADGTWVLERLPPGRYFVSVQGDTPGGEALYGTTTEVAVGDHNAPVGLVWRRGDIRLDAGRIAVHHEANRAGRRQHGGLRVAVAEVLSELDGLVPSLLRARVEIGRHELRINLGHSVAMLPHDAQERLTVSLVPLERSAMIARHSRRLRVRFTGHHRRDRRGVRTTLVAVVRQTARHQQRAKVRVPETERTVVVAVLLDRPSWITRVRDDDLLRGDERSTRGFERRNI
jgi:hypothetical protein